MDVATFHSILDADFYAGVPDSLLKPLCDFLYQRYGVSERHIVAANEGNAVGLAAGYHLATGRVPVVYMQNSGIGNAVNPICSLLNEQVYGIPCIFIIGWRGEPNVRDEPQHVYQGAVTLPLLNGVGIRTCVVDSTTSENEVRRAMEQFRIHLDAGGSVAFVIRKGALAHGESIAYHNGYSLRREDVINQLIQISQGDVVISTTGKASRELFEARERADGTHQYDFLTVGSMGHNSSIALGLSLHKPNAKVWCIDGDGSLLMHMGALAVLGSNKPKNVVHVIINNGSHETVGGTPTVMGDLDVTAIALGCGYPKAVSVEDTNSLEFALVEAKNADGLCLVEVKCSIGSRDDLGRPTTTAKENKESFMEYLKSLE